jgi:hypothetical protein
MYKVRYIVQVLEVYSNTSNLSNVQYKYLNCDHFSVDVVNPVALFGLQSRDDNCVLRPLATHVLFRCDHARI